MTDNKKKNLNLFDDDGDDDYEQQGEFIDLNIEKKLNQNEKKTSKLIQLKSKVAYDSRFKINDRFIDDDDDDDVDGREGNLFYFKSLINLIT